MKEGNFLLSKHPFSGKKYITRKYPCIEIDIIKVCNNFSPKERKPIEFV